MHFLWRGAFLRKMRPAVIYGVSGISADMFQKWENPRDLRGKEPGRIFCGGAHFLEKCAPAISSEAFSEKCAPRLSCRNRQISSEAFLSDAWLRPLHYDMFYYDLTLSKNSYAFLNQSI